MAGGGKGVGTPDAARLLGLLGRFCGLRVTVVGDLTLDHYLVGSVGRISREYPVVVVEYEREEFRPGGAANTVANIAALGARAVPVGRVGDDEGGDGLVKLLAAAGCPTGRVLRDPGATTATKTRIVAGGQHASGQHLLRVDRLERGALGKEAERALVSNLEGEAASSDGFILSDYGGGTLAPAVVGAVLRAAEGPPKRYVGLDSRHRLLSYAGVTAATPNLEEAGEAAGRELSSEGDIEEAGGRLRGALGAEALLITRGSAGMSLFEPDADPVHIPVAEVSEVFDVTGAGDSVVATFTLARLAGGTFYEAAHLANLAGGLSVRHAGATPVPLDDLRKAVEAGEPRNL